MSEKAKWPWLIIQGQQMCEKAKWPWLIIQGSVINAKNVELHRHLPRTLAGSWLLKTCESN